MPPSRRPAGDPPIKPGLRPGLPPLARSEPGESTRRGDEVSAMARFSVPGDGYLMVPQTYCGEFTGWAEATILRERDGILTVREPTDPGVKHRFRRDELE